MFFPWNLACTTIPGPVFTITFASEPSKFALLMVFKVKSLQYSFSSAWSYTTATGYSMGCGRVSMVWRFPVCASICMMTFAATSPIRKKLSLTGAWKYKKYLIFAHRKSLDFQSEYNVHSFTDQTMEWFVHTIIWGCTHDNRLLTDWLVHWLKAFYLWPVFEKWREVLFWDLSPSPLSPPSLQTFRLISRLLLKLAFWNLPCAIYAKQYG